MAQIEESEPKYLDITERIIEAFYLVYNNLGYGFLEKVYENAMVIELQRLALEVVSQANIDVYYSDVHVGQYNADLLVSNQVLVELKAVQVLLPQHEAQLLNYLKATTYEVGLLLNFGPKPQIRRKVYDNTRKGSMTWLPKAY
ncbi:MAG: GxxExxY protein [Anaerolineae bacterium]